MVSRETLNNQENNERSLRRYLTSVSVVAALTLAACSAESAQTEEIQQDEVTQPSESLESTSTTLSPSPVTSTTEQETLNTQSENEDDSEEVDDTSENETGLDTSYWNLPPDKVEVLSYLAIEHGYPVSAEKGDFTEGAAYDEILFEASQAFHASRNTHSLLPLANYFGYETVEEWDENRSQSVYQLEDSFGDFKFYKSVTEEKDGFTQFDRAFDRVFIEELYLADGTRSLSGEDLKAYTFDLGLAYAGGGLSDPSITYTLDESNWDQPFPYNMTTSYGLTLDIAADGTIKSFGAEYGY